MKKITRKHIEENREKFVELFKHLKELFPDGFDSMDIRIKAKSEENKIFREAVMVCFQIPNMKRCKRQFTREFETLSKYIFDGRAVIINTSRIYPFKIIQMK